MPFYFPLSEKQTNSKVVYDCKKCKLIENKQLKSPKISPVKGSNYNGLVILGQRTTADDDKTGFPFSNNYANILKNMFFKNGVPLKKEAAFINAASCYTHKKSDMANKCCESILENRLHLLKPKVIVCCGDVAFKTLFKLKEKTAISKIRGRLIPNYYYNCLVYVLYDIYDASMYRTNKNDGSVYLSYYHKSALQWDIEKICNLWKDYFYKRSNVNKVLEKRKILKNVKYKEVTTWKELEEVFDYIKQTKRISLDYETTNTKPYDEFFEIVSIGLGDDKQGWVIHEDFWVNNPVIKKMLRIKMRELIQDKNILKVIQNAKFEDLCSRYWFGTKPIENAFCTMLATHVVDERGGCTSQDFQNLTRFGIPPYSDSVKKFLQSEENEKTNTIRKAPKKELIKYNALDVITCFCNFLELDNVLLEREPNARKCYDFFHQGHYVFADLTEKGVYVNQEAFNKHSKKVTDLLEQTEFELMNLPEVKEYNQLLHLREEKGEVELKQFMAHIKQRKK